MVSEGPPKAAERLEWGPTNLGSNLLGLKGNLKISDKKKAMREL